MLFYGLDIAIDLALSYLYGINFIWIYLFVKINVLLILSDLFVYKKKRKKKKVKLDLIHCLFGIHNNVNLIKECKEPSLNLIYFIKVTSWGKPGESSLLFFIRSRPRRSHPSNTNTGGKTRLFFWKWLLTKWHDV